MANHINNYCHHESNMPSLQLADARPAHAHAITDSLWKRQAQFLAAVESPVLLGLVLQRNVISTHPSYCEHSACNISAIKEPVL